MNTIKVTTDTDFAVNGVPFRYYDDRLWVDGGDHDDQLIRQVEPSPDRNDQEVEITITAQDMAEAESYLEYAHDIVEESARSGESMNSGDMLIQVMTTSEADGQFNLPEGTAKLAANRGSIRARKSAGTWLIRRSDALAKWGHSAKLFAIAITLAVIVANLPA
jgi:hypothetical protein